MSQKLEKFHKYLDLYQNLVKVNAGKFVDDQLAEDVAQETFLKMYERLDYLKDDTVKQWLIVVSGNIAKDYVRKGGKYETNVMKDELLMAHMDRKVESAEECYEKDEKHQAVLELLRTACDLLYEKNPNWYYVMLDSCYMGMSSAEIAVMYHTTSSNIDVMKSRARKYLRKKLGKQYYDFF